MNEFVTPAQAAASTQKANALASLADAIKPSSSESSVSLLKGTVTAVVLKTASVQPTATITLMGDTVPIAGVRYVSSYFPTVGDTVIVGKQGSDIVILGQIEGVQATTGTEGWTTFTPSTGTALADTPQYRLIYDHGSPKVEFRGAISFSGSPTSATILTLATQFRPRGDLTVPVVVNGIGSTGMVTFYTTGVVTVRAIITADTTAETGDGGGSPTSNNIESIDHAHNAPGGGGGTSGPYIIATGAGSGLWHTHWAPLHRHAMPHKHATQSGDGVATIGALASVNLNGIAYYA